MEREEALDRVVAEHAIGRIMPRYGLAIDAQDMEAFRACFHADAKLHYGTDFSPCDLLQADEKLVVVGIGHRNHEVFAFEANRNPQLGRLCSRSGTSP